MAADRSIRKPSVAERIDPLCEAVATVRQALTRSRLVTDGLFFVSTVPRLACACVINSWVFADVPTNDRLMTHWSSNATQTIAYSRMWTRVLPHHACPAVFDTDILLVRARSDATHFECYRGVPVEADD